MKKQIILFPLVLSICIACNFTFCQEADRTRFIQIPGPNPILTPGPKGNWDSGVIEASDAFKDHDTYYLYFHGTGERGYQLGAATADNPLGPWKKYGKNPVLKVGAGDSWDNIHVACAFIHKEKTDKYYMFYSGYGRKHKWGIGLATASSPVGPWKKHKNNPIMKDFGYVGGLINYKNKYYLYTAHPIGSTGADYSPMSLAIADSLEGPYKEYEGNPVLKQGPWGSWDDGGYSEAEVFYKDGVFHMFYGGTKLHPKRILSRESIGYAYSLDGKHFIKHQYNPVAIREMVPDGAALAEVHVVSEGPFIYLFHTLRYNSRDGAEDIGMQVLATQRPFKLQMPVVMVDSIGAGKTTSLDNCRPLCLDSITTLVITLECTCTTGFKGRIQVRIKSSCDGLNYDTIDFKNFFLSPQPGGKVRRTFILQPVVKYMKVQIENRDKTEKIMNASVYATVGG